MIPSFIPKPSTLSKLFVAGATVGPLVDSIHNQCLLEYDVLPVSLPALAAAGGTGADAILRTSWLIPPLLGIAYVVLGGILPRVMQGALSVTAAVSDAEGIQSTSTAPDVSAAKLRSKAFVAVFTTAMIIKLSDLLQTRAIPLPDGAFPDATQSLVLMIAASLLQWAVLDGTPAALLAASITSVGGPLSELPFVALGAWHYIPSAADYLPLSSLAASGSALDAVASSLFGEGYRDIALSSITGPCYFAVTMDSIALGRWFDSQDA